MCDSVCSSIRAAPSASTLLRKAGIGTSHARPLVSRSSPTGRRSGARRRGTAQVDGGEPVADEVQPAPPRGDTRSVNEAIWMWFRRSEATAPPSDEADRAHAITTSCTQIVGALKA